MPESEPHDPKNGKAPSKGSDAPAEGKSRKEWVIDHLDRIVVGVVIAVIAIGLGSIFGLPGSGGGGSSSGAEATTDGGSNQKEDGEGSTPAPGTSTVVEYADNTNGSPVFADPMGTPLKGPGVIPYGTKVLVGCFAEDESGIPSVSGFYRISGGPWDGDYVVADTMTNGGPVGTTTTPNIDPRVPRCSAGE